MLADIPGLIEGASEGAGLGTRFLGHVERTAVLIHLVDGTQDDVAGAWRTVRGELDAYGEGLTDKAEILAMTKVDAMDPEMRAEQAARLEAVAGRKPLLVSAVSGEGVTELLRVALIDIREARAVVAAESAPPEAWRP